MKKIIALLCLLSLCLPLCACTSELQAETVDVKKTETAKETKQEKKQEKGEIVYPAAFAVGYARIDITGSLPIPIFEDTGTKIADPLYLTCTAVWDGEQVALLMSADLRGIQEKAVEGTKDMIYKQFKIPKDNIIINCTHTHSAPVAGTGGEASRVRWNANYYKQLPIVVEEALRDLDVVEGVFTGKSHTESLTFVRRYLMPDGTYKTHGDKTALGHETEADTQLQTLRFDRKSKKDVLMINYQTHHCSGIGKGKVSADFVAPYRTAAEKELDCHFVYHQGAGGNINFISPIPDERKYPNYISAAEGFMIATRDALSKEEPIQTGKIQMITRQLTVTVKKDPPERVEAAKKVMEADEALRSTLATQYGFETWRAANSTLTRADKGDTEQMPLTTISFGEIAFAAAPIEMFDTNGKQVRDGSPFKTTYICSLTNGSFGYVPSALAFPHGSYEVNACSYVPGTGEQIAEELINMLNECKSAS
ncbi:MAG: hypothetical protein E7580_01385 [Ruminococcaceae bacterium]|nr:hypothetical protein [Oscillospiraceae bacterium]